MTSVDYVYKLAVTIMTSVDYGLCRQCWVGCELPKLNPLRPLALAMAPAATCPSQRPASAEPLP